MRGTQRMAPILLTTALALGSVALSGCQSASKRVASAPEPGLSGPVEPGATVVEAPVSAAPAVSFVDRHPLFSKPREYYDRSTSSNKFVKSAKATVIGIPAGIFGEIKQIVKGPAQPTKS
ncbi:MAG: hypothetical protein LC745_09650 [Planctomycetia bacterium]|nr:hypothetical protein [Planctomycetia bacterium]